MVLSSVSSPGLVCAKIEYNDPLLYLNPHSFVYYFRSKWGERAVKVTYKYMRSHYKYGIVLDVCTEQCPTKFHFKTFEAALRLPQKYKVSVWELTSCGVDCARAYDTNKRGALKMNKGARTKWNWISVWNSRRRVEGIVTLYQVHSQHIWSSRWFLICSQKAQYRIQRVIVSCLWASWMWRLKALGSFECVGVMTGPPQSNTLEKSSGCLVMKLSEVTTIRYRYKYRSTGYLGETVGGGAWAGKLTLLKSQWCYILTSIITFHRLLSFWGCGGSWLQKTIYRRRSGNISTA